MIAPGLLIVDKNNKQTMLLFCRVLLATNDLTPQEGDLIGKVQGELEKDDNYQYSVDAIEDMELLEIALNERSPEGYWFGKLPEPLYDVNYDWYGYWRNDQAVD